MNKWKIAFWICLFISFLGVCWLMYGILDQGVTITHMRDGYEKVQSDLRDISEIVNKTDLSKKQIRKQLENHPSFKYMDFKSDTISLEQVNLIFRNNKLYQVKNFE